ATASSGWACAASSASSTPTTTPRSASWRRSASPTRAWATTTARTSRSTRPTGPAVYQPRETARHTGGSGMGMEQAVTFEGGPLPAWGAVRDLLAGRGYPVQTRMIDGELAFPDEAPPEEWRELRVGTPGGMVTLRREPGRVVCVTWGNAQGELL